MCFLLKSFGIPIIFSCYLCNKKNTCVFGQITRDFAEFKREVNIDTRPELQQTILDDFNDVDI
jgi:hypothetical protein